MRSIFFLACILLVILVSGCQTGGFRRSGQDTRTYDFHTGSDGLVMTFLPGNPPPRIYEGDSLHLVMEYANKGATPIEGGLFYVSGYDPQYIHLSPSGSTGTAFNAEGKSVFNPQGELSQVIEFTDPAVEMPPNTDRFRQIFKVSSCYPYKTEASAQVCVDPDPRGLEVEDKVCVMGNIGLKTQGAPVAVTSVEQEAARDQIQFKVHVSNVGRGTVLAAGGDIVSYSGDISPSSLGIPIANCHRDLTREQIDKVYIRARVSGQELECFPRLIRLNPSGSGFSFCRLTLSTMSTRVLDAYMTNLDVDLYYGYRDTITVPVEVLKLPGGLTPYGYR